jgi:uncharacterized protein (TIGR02246 family)
MTAYSDAEKAAACDVVTRVNAAWDKNDAAEFAAVYTADATLILSGDRFFQGRDHIREQLELSFQGPHKGTRLLADVVSFRWLRPGIAALVTEGGVLAPGETAPIWERALRATWITAKQENGEWLVAAYQNGRRADGALRGEHDDSGS